jgi:hypothetical protein
MGFIFRTVFWLGLAMVILPPQARLGGDDTADFEQVDLGRELQNAGSTLWSLGVSALNTCDTNPGLCKAGVELWNTTVRTSTSLAGDAQNQWEKEAKAEPRAKAKIQARVE